MFLSENEIKALTGYKYAKKQIEWLTSRGYKYDITADGKPKVLVSYLEIMLGAKPSSKNANTQPDFSVI